MILNVLASWEEMERDGDEASSGNIADFRADRSEGWIIIWVFAMLSASSK